MRDIFGHVIDVNCMGSIAFQHSFESRYRLSRIQIPIIDFVTAMGNEGEIFILSYIIEHSCSVPSFKSLKSHSDVAQ